MKKFLLVLLSLLVIMSCSLDSKPEEDSKKKEIAGSQEPGSQEPGSQEPGNQEPGNQEPGNQEPGSPIALSRGLLKDSEGNLIGYVLNAWSREISIITEKGYMVDVDWKGELGDWRMYFTEVNGEGIPFKTRYDNETVYGKVVYPSNDKIYIPKNVENGIAQIEDTNLIAKSEYDNYYEKFEDITSNGEKENCIVFKEVTKADIGFPETISLPLTIDFKQSTN